MSTRSMSMAGIEIDPKNPKKCRIGQQNIRNVMRNAQRMSVGFATKRPQGRSAPESAQARNDPQVQAAKTGTSTL